MDWNELADMIAKMSPEARARPVVVDCDYEMFIAKDVYVDEEGQAIIEADRPKF